jgi:predicted GIY-YIG superfamily endonuclease
MPDGTWRGSSPLAEGDHMPARGRCVVYVLYDAAGQPCYVGSTQHLLVRLQSHRHNGKAFTSWTASACADREAAYQLEERLLSEYQPYLNRKRSR